MKINFSKVLVILWGTIAPPLGFCLIAGTIWWPEAWIYTLIHWGFISCAYMWLSKNNPDLLEERYKAFQLVKDQKFWDMAWYALMLHVWALWLIIMPLDAVRFRWSSMPVSLEILGAFVTIAGLYLVYRTIVENPYLVPHVRFQEERGHAVISTGLYGHVRHPMYAGVITTFLGMTLLLGSVYGLLFIVILLALLMWRSVHEERTLLEELPGYAAYMEKVRYRFVPHVW